MQKAVLLDRDGVLNVERGEYTFRVDDFVIEYRVPDALKALSEFGYLNIVVTNQAGIAKGLYTAQDMHRCHQKLMNAAPEMITDIFYSPHHESYTRSLARKPGTLMLERAVAKYELDISNSWMIGDKERDLIPAKVLGLNTIHITTNQDEVSKYADFRADNLFQALTYLIN